MTDTRYRYSQYFSGQLDPCYEMVRQAIRVALLNGASIDQIAEITNEEVSRHSQNECDIQQIVPYPNTPKLIVKGVDIDG